MHCCRKVLDPIPHLRSFIKLIECSFSVQISSDPVEEEELVEVSAEMETMEIDVEVASQGDTPIIVTSHGDAPIILTSHSDF